jgi:hypothetical protein
MVVVFSVLNCWIQWRALNGEYRIYIIRPYLNLTYGGKLVDFIALENNVGVVQKRCQKRTIQ